MTAVILLFGAFLLLWFSPFLAALALSGAFYAASWWKDTHGEGLALIVFWGAVAGVICAFLGW